jgi:type I restriction enzyme S subunit
LGGLESSFIYYFLSRRSFVEEGKNRMKGAVGHKRVAKDWIANHLICYPKSLESQKQIVAQLDQLQTQTKKLETILLK